MENTLSRFKYLALVGITLFTQAGISIEARANSGVETDLLSLQQQVTGVVTDENGLPIPGVAISIKNSSAGTTTDLEGRYSISVGSQDVLVFTYLGMTTSEEPVEGRIEINVALEEDVTALGEVEINAGYYYTTRRESTGNISRVTAEEIELQPVVSPIQALHGRMAGVEITPNGGGHAGGATTIRIRGTNSLREEGNLPLYIIDGVPINSSPIESTTLLATEGIDPLNNLNLSNIESIEVLKDADATAIYGSRGANGVVLITTKKGQPGKTRIEARVFLGASRVPTRLDLLNTEQYLKIRRQAFLNDGEEPTERNAPDLLLWDQNRYTDWQDFYLGGTSELTNANLVLSGGNQNTIYRIGGSYSTRGSVYPGEYDYQKGTGEANLFHTSQNNKFNLNLSGSFGLDENHLLSTGTLSGSTLLLPPNAPALFKDDGELNWQEWSEGQLTHPLTGYFNNSTTTSKTLITNLSLQYEFIKGLIFKSNFGYTFFTNNEFIKRPLRSYGPGNQGVHSSSHATRMRQSWIMEPQLLYTVQLGGLQMESIVGVTLQQNKEDKLNFQGSGYASESLIGNLAAADQITHYRNSIAQYHYNALFARLGINWQKKYFINLTGRRDGSSRFGPDKRFANFGAIGASWIFTEEPFIKNTFSFLSFGKLRGSYGTTGNDQIGDYGYLDAYEPTNGPGGLYPSGLANPEYSWEINRKIEAAVELGFLQDQINFSFSWYRNQSSNQLVGYPLPAMTGFPLVQANLPATVQNSGLELEGSFVNINRKNLRWTTTFNVSFPRNELIEYPNIDQSPYSSIYRVGHPLNISLLYNYEGLDPETGLYTVKDVNEDGRFDYQDQTFVFDQTRKYFLGVSNNVNYKGFALNFLWEFVKQNGIETPDNPATLSNNHSDILEALSEGSEYQLITRSPQGSIAHQLMRQSNFPIQDASFLRLKSLAVSYDIPKKLLNKIGVNAFKIFFTGQNLLTLTDYTGLDPDLPQTRTAFRNLKTITGGIQLNI